MFDVAGEMGIAGFRIGPLAIIIGIMVVCIIPQSRKAGQGILFGGGLLLLIGLSLCTDRFGVFS